MLSLFYIYVWLRCSLNIQILHTTHQGWAESELCNNFFSMSLCVTETPAGSVKKSKRNHVAVDDVKTFFKVLLTFKIISNPPACYRWIYVEFFLVVDFFSAKHEAAIFIAIIHKKLLSILLILSFFLFSVSCICMSHQTFNPLSRGVL